MSIHSLLATISTRTELNMAKRVHRFGHATTAEMLDLLAGAKLDPSKLAAACDKAYKACPVCAATGRPANKRKISTTHVHEAFNQELQADFTYVSIRGERFEVLNIMDLATRYV